MLSGTGIGRNGLAPNDLQSPVTSLTLKSFGFFLTDHAVFSVEDNRQSFAPSTFAALLNRNIVRKRTHAPQLKQADELNNPSLQKGEGHE